MSRQRFDLSEALHRVEHWLPTQGPIKDFIHHNTLHAFQHLSFHDAVCAAARLHGARAYMPGGFYLEAYRTGEIPESALKRALESAFADPEDRARARSRLLASPIEPPIPPGAARSGLRAAWTERLGGIPLDRLSHPPLFRLIGGYLDQGLSLWRMPGADRLGFFAAVGQLARSSRLPLYPLDAPSARALLELPAEEAAVRSLELVLGAGRERDFEPYLLESLLSQPGWAGMVGECERQPGGLLTPRRITLLDYAAVTWVTEVGCLEHALGRGFAPLSESARPVPAAVAPGEIPERTEEERLLAVWHEALEWSYAENLLGGVVAASKLPHPAPGRRLSARAFFCIDDRECSFRRHIEELDATIETYSTAGFFGLDFMYRGAGDQVAGKHCPAPVKPRHLVIEEKDASSPSPGSAIRLRGLNPLETHSHAFFRGWILSYALGLGAALRLALGVFRPSLAPVSVAPLSTLSPGSRLRLEREDDGPDAEGLWHGYSLEELADRVHAVLRSVGAGGTWPGLVVFFGHGSSSANNPYFAAYNCGACSGRSGAPNARAFAQAANMPEIRRLVRAHGIDIPDTTWFVGGLHDTSRDDATYFDVERVPERLRAAFDAFRASVERALALNAAERCRRFESVPLATAPEAALTEARGRAVSLFEPRPEYNHATNASAIVGGRWVSQGLFLDRRAFLNSYDPSIDPDGSILAGILGAVIPVCGGISLEYCFSRIDPWKYGAGTKLPQNVTGLVGVCNGIEGDLLTGLPTQMTEIHDPLRLLVVVEQSPELALAAARRDPRIFEWVDHEWVRYACVDPSTGEAWFYLDGRMRKLENLPAPRARWASSLEASRHGRENLEIAWIAAAEETPC